MISKVTLNIGQLLKKIEVIEERVSDLEDIVNGYESEVSPQEVEMLKEFFNE